MTEPRPATLPVGNHGPEACPQRLMRAMARPWRRVRPLAALGLAAGLSMASAAFFATAAQAQMTDITLVSSIDQAFNESHGRTEPLAQRFNTGAETYGYVLKSVEVAYGDNHGDSVSAKVCTVTGQDQPTDTCTDFTAPASFPPRNITFTAPGRGMLLAPNTKYAVVLTPDETGTSITYRTTGLNFEDSGGLPDWNIAGEYHLYNGTSWIANITSRAFLIHLRGGIVGTASPSATGAPDITGPAQVGGTLTTRIGGIADTDGLPTGVFPAGYPFQWIRVETNNEIDIPGATSANYRPVNADLGRTLKVRVHFFDRAFTLETLTSGETQPVAVAPGELRLVDQNGVETTNGEGRLEVFYQGQWGTVCDDRMDGSFTVYGNRGNVLRTVDNHAPTLACELLGEGYTTRAS